MQQCYQAYYQQLLQQLVFPGTDSARLVPSRDVKKLCPYKPVSSLDKILCQKGLEPLKLDWNEATVPPSPKVLESIIKFIYEDGRLNWYPEVGSSKLRRALSDYVSLPDDRILVTNGSDEALDLVCRAYLERHDRVLVPVPTYTHFLVYVQARGAIVDEFHPPNLFDSCVGELATHITPDTKIVYLVSPNNPTGVIYSANEVLWLAQSFPSTLFIVDEAYYEFCGKTAIPVTQQVPNVIVTRTFSKCFGIASLRVGYLCSCQKVLETVHRIYNPKSVNRLGQIAAQACLEDLPYYFNYVQEVKQAAEYLLHEVKKRGLEAKTTPANFMLLRFAQTKKLVAVLEQLNVYVRDRTSLPHMQGYIRITIPNLAQAKEFVARLDIALNELEVELQPRK